MTQYIEQDKDLIYALDIGTRSIVGVVGHLENDRFKVLDIEVAEHGKRAMMDGQIDDIQQTASLVRVVTDRLEERMKISFRRVCVAAAGRALRTQSGSFMMQLSGEDPIDAEQISQLETGAVSVAEEALQNNEDGKKQFFLVGYTVTQYCLDNYPLTTLQHHKGKKVEAHVVATFLPGEVIESLYATMRAANLQVASLTLEPIASMNATIPVDLRLLNLALVDIGAGTTDIAVCKDGSVVGYTMVTVAGDEITEAIMRAFLVDFNTAERMKRELSREDTVHFQDILGMENSTTAQEINDAIQHPMKHLTESIAEEVVKVNGGAPSALFMAGGGSKLNGLCTMVARELNMDERRVAVAGNNFSRSVFADELSLDNPEYATPLGIAISAGMGLLNDSYVVQLNGEPAKLFRNGVLTLRDILLMNGYTYGDMIGRTGQSLSVMLDGKRVVLRGEPAVPAILSINNSPAALSAIIHAGDKIEFTPAKQGIDANRTLGDLLGGDFSGRVFVNEQEAGMDTCLHSGDVVVTLGQREPPPIQTQPVQPKEEPGLEISPVQMDKEEQPEHPTSVQETQIETPRVSPEVPLEQPDLPTPQKLVEEEQPRQSVGRRFRIILNGRPLALVPKEDGSPFYLMDLLEYSGIDFDHLDHTVSLKVNGVECPFQHVLKMGDVVSITCE